MFIVTKTKIKIEEKKLSKIITSTKNKYVLPTDMT